MKMRLRLLFIGCFLFFAFKSNGQCVTGSAGYVCDSNKTYTNHGIACSLIWKSITITNGGFHQFQVRDSIMTSSTEYAYFEFYTCNDGSENLEVQTTRSFPAIKRNADNFSCGGGDKNEFIRVIAVRNSVQAIYLQVLRDSCRAPSDTFTLYYRISCRIGNLGLSEYPDSLWVGNVYNAYNGNRYYEPTGQYGTESPNFTHDFGGAQPPITSNCFMCSDSNPVDNDTFSLRYKMFLPVPTSYYKITTSSSNLFNLSANAGGTWLYKINSSRQQTPTYLDGRHLISSTVTNAGKWLYEIEKDTGNLKADIHFCQMNGDFSEGIGGWKAYVYDSTTFNHGYYNGTFAVSDLFFNNNWGSGQPSMTGERCSVTMNNDNYVVVYKMKYNFLSGRYKFRVKTDDGVSLALKNSSGTNTNLIVNSLSTGSKDVTSSFVSLSGDTSLYMQMVELTGNARASYVHCKEPADPGSIIASKDTVCQGDSVTLRAATIDGTQTQWYRSVCGDSTKYLGAGDSIMVAIDSSTTFYVRNRNKCVSIDTTNILDLFSQNCASKRVYKRTYSLPALDIDASVSSTSLNSNGSITVNLTGGAPPYSYNWLGDSIVTPADSMIILFNSFGGDYDNLQVNTLQIDTPGIYTLHINDSICYHEVYEFEVGNEVYFIYSNKLLKTDTIINDSIYVYNYSGFEKIDSVSWCSGFFFSNGTSSINSVISSIDLVSDTGALYFGFSSIDSATAMTSSDVGNPFTSLVDSTRQFFYFLNNNYYIIDASGLSASLGTFLISDKFSVQRNGAQFKFKKNNTVVRTNTMGYSGNIYGGGSVYAPISKGKFHMINY
jgi:hypothetical protein